MFFSKLEQIFSTWKHFLCNEILFLINMCTSTSFMVITFKRKNSTYRRVYPSHWRYTVIPEFEKFDFINNFMFEFSISNIQLFFIFLCRLIFFYISYTFKYLDTNNFLFKKSSFDIKNYYGLYIRLNIFIFFKFFY